METKLRIPTLLGLGILIIGLGAGIFLVSQQQSLNSRANQEAIPKNITISNLSSNRAVVYWQTDVISPGFVQAGEDTNLNLTFRDDRDTQTPLPHLLHFVTINNLSPNKTYFFKIRSGSVIYPDKEPLSFKTTVEIPPSDNPSLIGTILDSSHNPVSEALVILKIPGAESLATVTRTAGNFILPLASLLTEDSSQSFNIQHQTLRATLTINGVSQSSQVTFNLPLKAPILPAIILGQNLDLNEQIASSIITPTPETVDISKYDLNNDGVVNANDLAIIDLNRGRKPKLKAADLNNDGVVDQKDIDLFTAFLSRIFPTATAPPTKSTPTPPKSSQS